MSTPQHSKRVLEILRRAADSQPIPEQGHFVDDDELLACWSAGLLSPQEQRSILDHLAICPTCRHEVAERIRQGLLELPDASEESHGSEVPLHQLRATDERPPVQTVESPTVQDALSSRLLHSNWMRLVLAASILVCVGAMWWFTSSAGSARMLAQVSRDLQSGRADVALGRAEQLLGGKLDPATSARTKELLEEAGYRVAGSKLEDRDFKDVLEIEHRVAKHGTDSARLANLRLQAERGIPAELALSAAGSLVDYGYELDGSSRRKSLPIVDHTTERVDKEYQTTIAAHPHDVGLLVNRGQFLLSQARPDEARPCFGSALAIAPQSAIAHLGLGLVDFQEHKLDAALEHFETAARLDPNSVAAHLNAGVCLQAMNRPKDAMPYWRQVLKTAKDAQLRERIESQLLSPDRLKHTGP